MNTERKRSRSSWMRATIATTNRTEHRMNEKKIEEKKIKTEEKKYIYRKNCMSRERVSEKIISLHFVCWRKPEVGSLFWCVLRFVVVSLLLAPAMMLFVIRSYSVDTTYINSHRARFILCSRPLKSSTHRSSSSSSSSFYVISSTNREFLLLLLLVLFVLLLFLLLLQLLHTYQSDFVAILVLVYSYRFHESVHCDYWFGSVFIWLDDNIIDSFECVWKMTVLWSEISFEWD